MSIETEGLWPLLEAIYQEETRKRYVSPESFTMILQGECELVIAWVTAGKSLSRFD